MTTVYEINNEVKEQVKINDYIKSDDFESDINKFFLFSDWLESTKAPEISSRIEGHEIFNRPVNDDPKNAYWFFYRLSGGLQDTFAERSIKDKPIETTYPSPEMEWLGEESVKQDLFELFKPYDNLKVKLHELKIDKDKMLEQSVNYFIRLADGAKNLKDLYKILCNRLSKETKKLNNNLELNDFDAKGFLFLYENLVEKCGLKKSDLILIKPVLETYLSLVNGDEIDKETARNYIENNCWISDLKVSLKDNLELFNDNSKSAYTLNNVRKDCPAIDNFLLMINGFERFSEKTLSKEEKAELFEEFVEDYYTLPIETAKECLVAKLEVVANPTASTFKKSINQAVKEVAKSNNFVRPEAYSTTYQFMTKVLEEAAVTTSSPKDIIKRKIEEESVIFDSPEEISNRIELMREWLNESNNEDWSLDLEDLKKKTPRKKKEELAQLLRKISQAA